MSGVLRLTIEIVALLILALCVRTGARRLAHDPNFAMSVLIAGVLVASLIGAAGLVTSYKRAVHSYRSSAQLNDQQRNVAGSQQVTDNLRRLGVDGALVPVDGEPRWVSFTEWLRTMISPDDTFQVSISRRAAAANARFWINWRLLPRTAVSGAERADWHVLVDHAGPVSGSSSDGVRVFAPGYVLIRMNHAR